MCETIKHVLDGDGGGGGEECTTEVGANWSDQSGWLSVPSDPLRWSRPITFPFVFRSLSLSMSTAFISFELNDANQILAQRGEKVENKFVEVLGSSPLASVECCEQAAAAGHASSVPIWHCLSRVLRVDVIIQHPNGSIIHIHTHTQSRNAIRVVCGHHFGEGEDPNDY